MRRAAALAATTAAALLLAAACADQMDQVMQPEPAPMPAPPAEMPTEPAPTEPQFAEVSYANSDDCQAANLRQGRFNEGLAIRISSPLGSRSILAEVAATSAQQTQGLMCRIAIPDQEGMLFAFDDTSRRSFWMFNTHVPLDLIFINADGGVDSAVTMQPCPSNGQDETTWRQRCSAVARDGGYNSTGDVMNALELPGGWLERSGIVAPGGDFSEVTLEWDQGALTAISEAANGRSF